MLEIRILSSFRSCWYYNSSTPLFRCHQVHRAERRARHSYWSCAFFPIKITSILLPILMSLSMVSFSVVPGLPRCFFFLVASSPKPVLVIVFYLCVMQVPYISIVSDAVKMCSELVLSVLVEFKNKNNNKRQPIKVERPKDNHVSQ